MRRLSLFDHATFGHVFQVEPSSRHGGALHDALISLQSRSKLADSGTQIIQWCATRRRELCKSSPWLDHGKEGGARADLFPA